MDSWAQSVNCSTLTSRQETFQGKSYTKYNILDFSFNKCPQIAATKPAMPWVVKKTEWSKADEALFSEFIKKLGYSQCNTTDKCLSEESNLLRTEEDMLFTHYSDCADFPYYLRSYFAYKNNLPMTMISSFIQAPLTEQQLQSNAIERQRAFDQDGDAGVAKFDQRVADNRYSRNGNIPEAKMNIPSASGRTFDFAVVGPRIMDQVSSGTMRMIKTIPGYPETDFYSPQVSKASIKPGTVLYNVSGHVAIVYDITEKGEILFIDAHPDNSVSRGVFNPDFPVVRSTYGGNFKNFRPIRVKNPVMDASGVIIKGSVVAASDSELTNVSLEQYEGSEKNAAGLPVFKLAATDLKGVNFYDWVKFKLSGGKFRLDPIVEMKNEMAQLCQASQDRIAAVQAAVDNQVYLKSHPSQLPQNIFGADGEWESYSSPGRDLRLKLKILSIPESAKQWMARAVSHDPLISYAGNNLKLDLIMAYRQSVEICKINYKNSVGQTVTIGLDKLIDRVANISYDPYECPEVRWGANTPNELATCSDDEQKKEWHSLQQFLRNNLTKDTAAVHGWTLQQLELMNEHKEVDNNPNVNRFRIAPKLEAM
ncbi:MAG: hypothetical protein H7235_06465 [Bdellovibrionaceae bacterium]|nr:hypothetical protein [Pseudobdellovibrionaceae bacterium]